MIYHCNYFKLYVDVRCKNMIWCLKRASYFDYEIQAIKQCCFTNKFTTHTSTLKLYQISLECKKWFLAFANCNNRTIKNWFLSKPNIHLFWCLLSISLLIMRIVWECGRTKLIWLMHFFVISIHLSSMFCCVTESYEDFLFQLVGFDFDIF